LAGETRLVSKLDGHAAVLVWLTFQVPLGAADVLERLSDRESVCV